MDEYVTKEQVIDWYRPYGQTDEPIPFETLVSDLRDMKTADVSPVRHGRWLPFHSTAAGDIQYCSACEIGCTWKPNYCPNCGAKMDGDNDD
mgnify:CR=1 FL=1